jgi:hypothetical protein
MKIKVFQPNSHGKIEFTRAELEKLLNETYTDGFRDGEAAQREKSSWTWTSPYVYNDNITLTNGTGSTSTNVSNTKPEPIDKLTCTWSADTNKNKTSIATGATVKTTPDGTITVSSIDKETALKHVNDILASIQQIQNQPSDVFTNLAKELNF